MVELETSVHTNYRVYEETMDRLRYLIAQAEDTSATTQELSAGMEETSASVIAINESAGEIDKAISDFAEKVEEGAHTSNEISTNADKLSIQFIEVLAKRSDDTFSLKAGTLYPLLHNLEDKELASSYEKSADSGRVRKYYSITKKGRGALADKEDEWKTYVNAINQVLKGRGSHAILYQNK